MSPSLLRASSNLRYAVDNAYIRHLSEIIQFFLKRLVVIVTLSLCLEDSTGDQDEPTCQSHKKHAYCAKQINHYGSNVSCRYCKEEWTRNENCHPSSQNLTVRSFLQKSTEST